MAVSAMNYLQEHIWLPILIGIVSFIVLLLLIFLAYKLYRRCTRYDYTPLRDDLALPEKLSQARQIQRNEVRDDALLNFQFYMRSHNPKYSFSQHLPDMGSRVDKHWFLVREHGKWKDLVVTQCSKSPGCPLPFSSSNQKTIRDMLLDLQHPYIWPTADIDLWEEHEVVIVTQEFNSNGSLKDYIYNAKAKLDWSNKYGMKSRGLALKQIRLFGLQILKGALYLQENGFPPHCHIQAGNVIIKKGACRLSGYENVFLGYTSKLLPVIRRLLKEKPEAIDSLCMGHLLYEMGAGKELEEAVPTRAQLNRCQHPELIQLLEFIFDVAGDYPSLSDIADHHFFADVKLTELKKHPPQNIHLTAAMKALIKAAKKGKVLKSRSRTHVSSRSSLRNKNKSSSKRAPTTNGDLANSSQSKPSSAPAVTIPPPPLIQLAVPPPPSVPAPPPAVGFAQSSNNSNAARDVPNTEGRGALLSDIKKGMNLKKTVTRDKSAPKV
ncbi:slowpoke-binding protein isoform X1 [Strongylocentrotus purpuratus]|uniref:WH2 domain-containing protein n=1 Tax=Strongylocentrotus purpuratus TaxID=7668 RepID=A0A7M7RDC8_STRPU|nr:slowpoke-binding protein isoform X1 [Strongylocentrotus purpuratus]